MKQNTTGATLTRLSETYIRLVLAVGAHDADYVDAYYGPASFREGETVPLETIRKRAASAIAELKMLSPTRMDDMVRLRHRYIMRQMQALLAKVDILGGKVMTFDEESQALYDAVAPSYPEEHFTTLRDELGAALPGKGEVPARFDSYRAKFVIPKEKLDRVFKAAIDESRKRTAKRITLPEGESFAVEYVTDKPWSGYNWFKGNCHSLIQVNTDLPITVDRAVDLASHEGYPGHHVYNALLETHLVRERKWMEFTVYPLFSPQSLIAEGTANFGIDMAFPGEERAEFEREVLFPLAGLPPDEAGEYYRIHTLFLKLAYAGNEAARKYLDGKCTREEAVAHLTNYALMPADRALQRTKFFDKYRSYVINYNLGQDMVRRYIESAGGVAKKPDVRWKVFAELISSPRLPSGLL
jgi:hypothetical protein